MAVLVFGSASVAGVVVVVFVVGVVLGAGFSSAGCVLAGCVVCGVVDAALACVPPVGAAFAGWPGAGALAVVSALAGAAFCVVGAGAGAGACVCGAAPPAFIFASVLSPACPSACKPFAF